MSFALTVLEAVGEVAEGVLPFAWDLGVRVLGLQPCTGKRIVGWGKVGEGWSKKGVAEKNESASGLD